MWPQAQQGYPPRPVGADDPQGYWVSREVYDGILQSISLLRNDPNATIIPVVSNRNWKGRAALSSNQFVHGAYGSLDGGYPWDGVYGPFEGVYTGHHVYGGQASLAGNYPPNNIQVVQFPPAGTPVLHGSLHGQVWLPRHPPAGSMGMVAPRISYSGVRGGRAGNSHKKAEERKAKEEKKSERERALQLQKRQETVRLARQADIEGWSDEKLVFALRLRNTVHHELRDKVAPVENQ